MLEPVTFGFIIYLFIILVVGIYTSRHARNIKDFALGGQKLGSLIIALSERASSESAWLIIGLPGVALVSGLFGLWIVVGVLTGSILSWYIIAKKLRAASETHNALTLPELLAHCFGNSEAIRVISSLIITFFFTFYVAAQFAGAGKVLNVTFGLTHFQGMLIGASIIVFYTILGGFFAVAWTDVIQAIIMFGTLVVLPFVGYIELTNFYEPTKQLLDFKTLFDGKSGASAFWGAVGGLSWGLGYLGQPHIVVRYMASKSIENITKSRRYVIYYSIPAFFGALFIGLVGAQLLSAGVFSIDGVTVYSLTDKEKLMPMMANLLFNPWIAGIFISGAIAAMMSTADSQLLVTTTVLSEDIIGRYGKKLLPKNDLLFLSRVLTIIIGILAFYLAWRTDTFVFGMVSYAWGGLGSSFGPVLLLTLWWKKVTKSGVICGLLSGTFFTVFHLFSEEITPRLSAFVISFFVVIAVSLLTMDDKKEGHLTL